MSLLQKNATPAEIMRGCVFAENFENKDEIARNGGTITGNPSVFFGADLDGSNDYVEYALSGQEFNSDLLSFLFDINPDFAGDDGADHTLIDTTLTNRILFAKTSTNTLFIQINGVLIADISFATYGAYWLTGQRNVLVISSTSGSTDAWLNGTQILTADATAWGASIVQTGVVFGATKFAANKFDGKINKIQIYHGLLTAQEALDFYTGETYRYMNKAVLHLPMRAREHDSSLYGLPNEIINGDFTDWTDSTVPDNWAKTGTHDANNYVEEGSAGGTLRLVSDGTLIGIIQDTVESGKTYTLTFDVLEINGAGGKFTYNGGELQFTTIGRKEFVFNPTGTNFRLYRRQVGVASDFIIDNVVLKEGSPRTLDITKNANHAQFGDGATSTTYPTKNQRRGYSFDGGDYMVVSDTSDLEFPTGDFSFSFCAKGDSSVFSKGDGSAPANTEYILQLNGSGFFFRGSWRASTALDVSITELVIVTLTFDDSADTISIFVNGELKDTITSVTGSYASNLAFDFVLAAQGTLLLNKYAGDLYFFCCHPLDLTPLQAIDLYLNNLGAQNDV
jgi:hypothetical protein